MIKHINFSKPTNFTGRNGYMKCGGVEIFPFPDGTLLTAKTSRGQVGRCDIKIPDENLEEVGTELIRATNKNQKIPGLKVCAFVEVSTLVPKTWKSWFWAAISNKAPFSWGDNDRSLVGASDFANHCEESLLDCRETSQSAVTRFLTKVRALGQTYIDLEN